MRAVKLKPQLATLAGNVLRSSIFKFLLVGLFCATIEFLVFNISIQVFKINYLIANVLSLVISISINYVLSKAYVFQKSSYTKRFEIISFFFFSVLAVSLNQLMLWFFFKVIVMDIRVSKALAIVFVAAFNYLTKKYIVFKIK